MQTLTGHGLRAWPSARTWLSHRTRPILALKRLTVKSRETEKAGVTTEHPRNEQGPGSLAWVSLGLPAELGLASGGCWDCLGKEQQQVTGINRNELSDSWVAGPAH